MRCSADRLDLSRIIILVISSGIDTPHRRHVKRAFRLQFFLKKSLPNVLIPGISRLHVAADLRRILNYLATRCS